MSLSRTRVRKGDEDVSETSDRHWNVRAHVTVAVYGVRDSTLAVVSLIECSKNKNKISFSVCWVWGVEIGTQAVIECLCMCVCVCVCVCVCGEMWLVEITYFLLVLLVQWGWCCILCWYSWVCLVGLLKITSFSLWDREREPAWACVHLSLWAHNAFLCGSFYVPYKFSLIDIFIVDH